MFQPTPESTRRELRDESRKLLVRRLRIVLWIDIVTVLLFLAADLLALMPEPVLAAYAVYVIELGVMIAAVAALRRPGVEQWAVSIALVVTVSSIVTAASLGILTEDLVTAPLVFIILVMATATLFPWGVWPQLAVVAIAGACWGWNVKMATGAFGAAVGYPTLVLLVAFAASIYIAREFDRYRIAIEQRNVQLRGYRDVVENANDAILTFDLDGRITGANGGAEAIFGRHRDRLVGAAREHVLSVADPAGFAASWEEALRDNARGRIFSIEGRRVDGTLVPLEVKARPIVAEGRTIGSQAILRDVTEKRMAEQMRREFIAMLSHDMKTPLASILGFAEMLRDRTGGASELRPILDRIDANARIAHSLAVNFVDVARIETGSLDLRLESISLNEIVDQVLRHQESMARAREISLEAALDRDLPPLRLDRRHIDRVVANLVSNAIKFSPTRGRVRVGTTCEDGRVVLAVRDQGPGISPDDRTRLFERFRRIDNARVDGSGLGLYIVKQIVEAHGGCVSVDCPTEGGSTFRVAFDVRAIAA